MAGPGRPPKNRDNLIAELQEATQRAAAADAENDEAPPDEVVVNGVTYYRQAPPPAQPAFDPDPAEENVLIDLAPYSDSLTINGRKFFAGCVYRVSRDEARNMRSMMAETWRHEKSTGGAFSHLPGAKNMRMSMATGTIMNQPGAPGVMPNLTQKVG